MASTFGGMFPGEGVVPGTVEYNEHYNILPEEIEGYEPFSFAQELKKSIREANDSSNPINKLATGAEPRAPPRKPPPPPAKTPQKKKQGNIVVKNPVVPVPLSPVKSPKDKENDTPIAVNVTVSRPPIGVRTIPQTQFVGPIETTPTGLNFFRIEPIRLGSLPVSVPPPSGDQPIIRIPTYNMYNAPGRSTKSRPVLQQGVREIESFRPGDMTNKVLRTLDPEKLVEQRAKRGGKYYTNREVNDIALALGISATGKKKKDLVKKILERYEEWKKNAD